MRKNHNLNIFYVKKYQLSIKKESIKEHIEIRSSLL